MPFININYLNINFGVFFKPSPVSHCYDSAKLVLAFSTGLNFFFFKLLRRYIYYIAYPKVNFAQLSSKSEKSNTEMIILPFPKLSTG